MVVAFVALAAIGAVGYFAYRHEQKPGADICSVCERPIHAGMTYRQVVGDQVKVVCCPRCGMHDARTNGGGIREAWATDHASGESIPAQPAYYVEGGDAEYCTMHENPLHREPQGVSVRAYDRCLPTLVAFKTRPGAETYRARHGGRILDYAQAVESVNRR